MSSGLKECFTYKNRCRNCKIKTKFIRTNFIFISNTRSNNAYKLLVEFKSLTKLCCINQNKRKHQDKTRLGHACRDNK